MIDVTHPAPEDDKPAASTINETSEERRIRKKKEFDKWNAEKYYTKSRRTGAAMDRSDKKK